MTKKELVSPCGIACYACGLYKDNITEKAAQQTAKSLRMRVEDVPCEGCRSVSGCSVSKAMTCGDGCKTKACVYDKEIHNCSGCEDFPCDYLMPVSDKAGVLPHNTKIFNLSRIKAVGLDNWMKVAGDIQMKYFGYKFNYGQAPKKPE